MCAQFHPSEDLVVSASLDQTVRVWDISGEGLGRVEQILKWARFGCGGLGTEWSKDEREDGNRTDQVLTLLFLSNL